MTKFQISPNYQMKNRIFEPQSDLSRRVVGLAMRVHRTLGCGFSETVYRNALAIEWQGCDLIFEIHPTVSVTYGGHEVGVFQADIIINRELIVELKAVESLTSAHAAQLVNYLCATKIDHGLLINFGTLALEFSNENEVLRKRRSAAESSGLIS